jgi:hypothetical protein
LVEIVKVRSSRAKGQHYERVIEYSLIEERTGKEGMVGRVIPKMIPNM